MKRFIKPLIALFLLGALLAPSTAGAFENTNDLGPSWALPNDSQLGQHVFNFVDMYGEPSSNLYSISFRGMEEANPLCASISDANCANGYAYMAILPNCFSDSDVNCISDFGIVDQNKNLVKAEYKRNFPAKAQNEFQGSPAVGLPSGTTGSVYAIPGAEFGKSNLYYVRVETRGSGNSQSAALDFLDLQVFPVNYQDIPYEAKDAGLTQVIDNSTGKLVWGWSAPGLRENVFCVANSAAESKCLQRYEFPSNIRYFVKLRMSKIPSGWLHGRVAQPNISITKENNLFSLNIEGEPVSVPAVSKTYWWNQMPADLQAKYDTASACYINEPSFKATGKYCYGGRSQANTDPQKRNVVVKPDPWSAIGMEQLKLLLPYVNDQATAMFSSWSIRTLSASEMAGADKCFSDTTKVSGMVSTNATQYSAGPPVFDKSTQSLVYQVAAPHLTNKGKVFEGSYDLSIPSSVARCLYSFTNAPIKAEISITTADGIAKVATTSLVERDGWLNFSAKGFTFSDPTIQVKLFQDVVEVAPTPTPTPSATATPTPEPTVTPTPTPTPTKTAVVKKITITCVKGKLIKKVTAIKPTCPSGYKRK